MVKTEVSTYVELASSANFLVALQLAARSEPVHGVQSVKPGKIDTGQGIAHTAHVEGAT